MNPVTMTIINPRKEYWPSRGSNQRPLVLKYTLLTECLTFVILSVIKRYVSIFTQFLFIFRRGSTIAEADVVFVDNDSVRRQYSDAVTDLALNNATVAILGEETVAEGVQIRGVTCMYLALSHVLQP